MKTLQKRKRLLALTAGAAAVMLSLSGCGGDGEAADEISSWDEFEEMNLRIGTFGGPDDVHTQPLEAWAAELNEVSGGKLTFEFFYGGSLVPVTELADGVGSGTIDAGTFFPAYSPAQFPIDAWASPLAFTPDDSPIVGGMQGIGTTLEWGFETPEYIEEIESQGIKVLLPRIQTSAAYNLACSEPVTSLDDIVGKRIRVGGEAHAGEVSALGGTPVTIDLTETYTSLQQGVIDCTVATPSDMERMGLDDVADQYTFIPFTGWTSNTFGVNAELWESLPTFVQQAMWDALPAYLEGFLEAEFAANYSFVDLGLTPHQPDEDLIASLDEYHESVRDSRAAATDTSLSDASASLDQYMSLTTKWYDDIVELGYDGESADWFEVAENTPLDDVDFQPFLDLVETEILEQNRP